MFLLRFVARKLLGPTPWRCPWCKAAGFHLLPHDPPHKDRCACDNCGCGSPYGRADVYDLLKQLHPSDTWPQRQERLARLQQEFEAEQADDELEESAKEADGCDEGDTFGSSPRDGGGGESVRTGHDLLRLLYRRKRQQAEEARNEALERQHVRLAWAELSATLRWAIPRIARHCERTSVTFEQLVTYAERLRDGVEMRERGT